MPFLISHFPEKEISISFASKRKFLLSPAQDYASIKTKAGKWGDYPDDPKVHGWNPGQVVCLQQLNSPGMY